MPPHPATGPQPDSQSGPPAPQMSPTQGALHLQIAHLRDRHKQLVSRTEHQERQIAALATRLRDSDARLAALAAETLALRTEVAALRGSNSWRITAPGRALRRGWWWLCGTGAR